MKLLAAGGSGWPLGRSPCGERGLKYRANAILGKYSASLPVRGAWIEISSIRAVCARSPVAPRAGSVD